MVTSHRGAFIDSIHRGAIRCNRVGNHHRSGWDFGSSEQGTSGARNMEEGLAMARRHEMKLWKRKNRCLWISVATSALCVVIAFAQTPAAEASRADPPVQSRPSTS